MAGVWHQNALRESQLSLAIMMIVGEVKVAWNAKLYLIESQCLQSPKPKSLWPKPTAEKPTYAMGFHRSTSSAPRKKCFPLLPSSRGFSRYEADVYPIAPWRHGRSCLDFGCWLWLRSHGRKLRVYACIFLLWRGLNFSLRKYEILYKTLLEWYW